MLTDPTGHQVPDPSETSHYEPPEDETEPGQANGRQRLAEQIVSYLEEEFNLTASRPDWDHDNARRCVASMLPMDDEEIDYFSDIAEADELRAPPLKPGPIMQTINRIRAQVSAEGLSIACTLNAAADRLDELAALRKLRERMLDLAKDPPPIDQMMRALLQAALIDCNDEILEARKAHAESKST